MFNKILYLKKEQEMFKVKKKMAVLLKLIKIILIIYHLLVKKDILILTLPRKLYKLIKKSIIYKKTKFNYNLYMKW